MEKVLTLSMGLLTLIFTAILSGCGDDAAVSSSYPEGFDEAALAITGSSSVTTQSINSSVLGRNVQYNIYLPPSYSSSTTKKYPVMFLLHGYGDDHTAWATSGSMKTITDTAISNGSAAEMIIVMPNGFTAFYCNGYTSGMNYETFLSQELVPYIDSNYRTYGTKETRSIAGLSMGGYGTALHLFKHYEQYSSGYAMSGAFTVGGAPSLSSLISGYSAAVRASLPPFTMECGTEDSVVISMNTSFHSTLNQYNVAHEYITRSGSHTWDFWKVCLPKALQFATNNYTIPGDGDDDDDDDDDDVTGNLALGKTATASSTENSSYPASAAVDGSTTTRWSSSFSNNQYIYVDLGSAVSVSKVILKWEAAYGSAYKIQTSSNAYNWTDVANVTNGNGGTDEISFTAVTARYVRMYGITRATSYGFSLYEFEVYGPSSGDDDDDDDNTANLALGKTAGASSTENSNYPASAAVDGSTTTRWSSSFSNNQYIYVDLGSAVSVSKVILKWEAAYGSAYKIQTSSNAYNWTDVANVTNGNGGTDEISFTAVTARYVRMYGITRATSYGFSLYEFEVY